MMGDPLYQSEVYENTLTQYEKVKVQWETDPDHNDNIIWFGRWTAYRGDFREAIRIYSKGIKKYP